MNELHEFADQIAHYSIALFFVFWATGFIFVGLAASQRNRAVLLGSLPAFAASGVFSATVPYADSQLGQAWSPLNWGLIVLFGIGLGVALNRLYTGYDVRPSRSIDGPDEVNEDPVDLDSSLKRQGL